MDDNCTGGIQYPSVSSTSNPNYIAPEKGYETAQNLIDDANNFVETIGANEQWHSNSLPATESDPQCVPIRYVLSGVYFHCDTHHKETSTLGQVNTAYAVNSDSEINLYIRDCTATNGCTGVASFSHTGVIVQGLEWYTIPTFVHEVGHTLSLSHTHGGINTLSDGCDDTPGPYNLPWDRNCDGTEIDNITSCWDTHPIVNGLDACEDFCEPHPCCDWSIQNNNVMTKSTWAKNEDYAAFTPCQTERMLTRLSSEMHYCSIVEEISTDCPPPKAFIDIQPIEIIEPSVGQFWIWLEGSDNEEYYKLNFYTETGSLLHSTGWRTGQAKKYSISTCRYKATSTTWPGGFEAETNYTAVLTVENYCGDEAEMSLNFTTPEETCVELDGPGHEPDGPGIIIGVHPNPVFETLQIEYELDEASTISIFSYDLNSGVIKTLKELEMKPSGGYLEFKSVSDHLQGSYMLLYELNGVLHPATTFIKM